MKNTFNYCRLIVIVSLAGICGLPSLHALANESFRYQLSDKLVRVEVNNKVLELRALEDNAIEVHEVSEDKYDFPSFSLKENLVIRSPNIRNTDSSLFFANGDLVAEINKDSLSIDFRFAGQLMTRLISDTADDFAYPVQFNFQLADNEKLLGGGERIVGMNRRGHRFPLYNRAHYGYTTESEQMYYSIPAVMSDKKYAVLFDNSAKGWLDTGKNNPSVLSFSAVGGRKSFVVTAAKSWPKLVQNFTAITGRQPMPPRWALGNIASRFGYHSQAEVENTVKAYFENGYPLEAIILDLYWFGPDIKGHMGNLDWDKRAFPQPRKMIQSLRKQGIKTIPITEPFVLSSSKRWKEAKQQQVLATNGKGEPYRFDFYFGNTGLIDIFYQPARKWFANIYSELFEQGVGGTWGDLGEPEVHPDDILHQLSSNGKTVTGAEVHNAYGHEWAKMVYQLQRKMQPESRPFIMMRSGTAGSQRFGMIPWTGDVSRSWGGLKPQVELGLQMSLLGLGYIHSDAGGFAGGEKFDPELYQRWLQFAAFQPVFRPHAQEQIPSEPVFHDAETQRIVKQAIQLRYQLMPYLYTLAFENSQTGMPLMRPRFFDNEKLFDNKTDYLWGDNFLIAPVTESGKKTQSIKNLTGRWFNFWTDEKISANQYEFPLTKTQFPVLVKAGSFIPMVPVYQSADNYSSEKLTLHYYHDDSVHSASGQMYEDDGKTFDAFAKGQYELLNFHSKQEQNVLTIQLNREKGKSYGDYPKRKIQLMIHGLDEQRVVYVNGERVESYFRQEFGRLSFLFDWNGEPLEIKLRKSR